LLLQRFDGDDKTITMLTSFLRFRRRSSLPPKPLPESGGPHYCKLTVQAEDEGRRYLRADVPQELVAAQDERLTGILGPRYETFVKSKLARDGKGYHLTVVAPNEWSE